MRKVCVISSLKREQWEIGEPYMIVEVDESLFMKQKNNAGRIPAQRLIFSEVCQEMDECILVNAKPIREHFIESN